MKTLYIHGLENYPGPEKFEILRKHGLDPVAPHLNYKETLGIYEILKDAVLQKDVKFIIGSSLGGYLGYLLAEEMGLPCLLFNPTMHYTDVFYSKMPEIKELNCPTRYIVLGGKDKEVDPVENLYHFKKLERKGLEQLIISCEWLGHRIDFMTFDEMVNWAVYSTKLFNKKA